MLKAQEYIENLTDEQLQTSAYMCCQWSALKQARDNIESHIGNCQYFNSKEGKQEYLAMRRENGKHVPKFFIALSIVLLIFLLLGFILILFGFSVSFSDILEILGILLIALIPLSIEFIIDRSYLKAYKKLQSDTYKVNDEDFQELKRLSDMLSKMEKELNKSCVIPKRYWEYALNLMEYIYVNYRATNLKEAICALEDDMRQAHIESRMAELEQAAANNANALGAVMSKVNDLEYFQSDIKSRVSGLEWYNRH